MPKSHSKKDKKNIDKEKTLSVFDLYRYVFDQGAVIDLTQTPASKRDHKLKERQNLIKAKFAKIVNGKEASSFRQLLRAVNSSELEKVLFANNTDELKITNLILPNVEEIKNQFTRLNDIYQYFDDQKQDDFLVFFRAYKLYLSYVNNTAYTTEVNNKDYLNAYKILVLFGKKLGKNPLAGFESYLMNIPHNYREKDPLLQIRILSLSINNPKINLARWQKLNARDFHFVKAFTYAPNIKRTFNKDPQTRTEAENLAIRVAFPNADKYFELAKVCYENNLDNSIFEKCLNFEKERKKRDNLPNISINGVTVKSAYEDYWLVKLPVDDPRAYLLGSITNCCQRIGGTSEYNIFDGLTYENNGFYVLLKRKKKANKHAHPFSHWGKINYHDYKILGQSYAWLSKNQNLVFDYWVNLRRSDDPITLDLLTEFSKRISQNSNILRVSIGLVGIPLSNDLPQLSIAELMSEGRGSIESSRQGLIYLNMDKLNKELQLMNSDFPNNRLVSEIVDYLKDQIIARDGYNFEIIQSFRVLVKILQENNLLTKNLMSDISDQLLKNSSSYKVAEAVKDAIEILIRGNALSKENLYLIILDVRHAKDIAILIVQLSDKQSYQQKTETLFNYLASGTLKNLSSDFMSAIKEILERLNNQRFFSDKIIMMLFSKMFSHSPADFEKIKKGLIKLIDNNLLSLDHFTFLLNAGAASEFVAQALIDCAQQKVILPLSFKTAIITNPWLGEEIAIAASQLALNNSLNIKNINLFIPFLGGGCERLLAKLIILLDKHGINLPEDCFNIVFKNITDENLEIFFLLEQQNLLNEDNIVNLVNCVGSERLQWNEFFNTIQKMDQTHNLNEKYFPLLLMNFKAMLDIKNIKDEILKTEWPIQSTKAQIETGNGNKIVPRNIKFQWDVILEAENEKISYYDALEEIKKIATQSLKQFSLIKSLGKYTLFDSNTTSYLKNVAELNKDYYHKVSKTSSR